MVYCLNVLQLSVVKELILLTCFSPSVFFEYKSDVIFAEMMKTVLLVLAVFILTICYGKCNGFSLPIVLPHC